VPRYRCRHDGCDREVFAHDTSRLARPGSTTTRRCATFILRRLMLDKATVAAVARELGRSWDTVNDIAVEATTALLLTAGPARLDGVRVLGVDEHKWAHTRTAQADGFVTVITDLTDVVAGQGSARLLDVVPGRSAAAMTGWLAARDQAFRDRVEIVAMDGFGGDKNAATEALPDAVTVMDPFHVVALAGHKLDLCRQRVQQDTTGHRGRSGDPLYRVRRTLRTRLALLTDRQRARLEAVLALEEHVAVEVTWWAYQQIIAAYADEDRQRGKTLLTTVIDRLRTGLPAGLDELATLGRTLHRRRDDVLAYFTHRASNGPTETINGRLEALRRNALGFRNLINYRIRSLLHCGALAL
jgi:transposase